MKLSKLWKVTISPMRGQELTPEQKVVRQMGFVYVKSSTEEQAKNLVVPLVVEKAECVGIIAEKIK